jgi:hypothetical protein
MNNNTHFNDLYILHITMPDGTLCHYAGKTKKNRFKERLKEHRQGKGSIITNSLRKRGARIEGQLISHNEGPLEEYIADVWKDRLCPLCHPDNVMGTFHRLIGEYSAELEWMQFNDQPRTGTHPGSHRDHNEGYRPGKAVDMDPAGDATGDDKSTLIPTNLSTGLSTR